MNETLTFKEAYKAMFIFVREYYYRTGRPDSIGNLLSDTQLLESGIPADPASWQDWLDAVNKVIEDFSND